MSAADMLDDELAAGPVADCVAVATDELLEVRTAGRRQREWTRRRDDAIVAAYRAGHSLREIAVEVQLSHSGVKRIVERCGE